MVDEVKSNLGAKDVVQYTGYTSILAGLLTGGYSAIEYSNKVGLQEFGGLYTDALQEYNGYESKLDIRNVNYGARKLKDLNFLELLKTQRAMETIRSELIDLPDFSDVKYFKTQNSNLLKGKVDTFLNFASAFTTDSINRIFRVNYNEFTSINDVVRDLDKIKNGIDKLSTDDTAQIFSLLKVNIDRIKTTLNLDLVTIKKYLNSSLVHKFIKTGDDLKKFAFISIPVGVALLIGAHFIPKKDESK